MSINKIFKKDKSIVISRGHKYEYLLVDAGFELITQFYHYGIVKPSDVSFGMTAEQYFKTNDKVAKMLRINDNIDKVFMSIVKEGRSNGSKKAAQTRRLIKQYGYIDIAEGATFKYKDAYRLRCKACQVKMKLGSIHKMYWIPGKNVDKFAAVCVCSKCNSSFIIQPQSKAVNSTEKLKDNVIMEVVS